MEVGYSGKIYVADYSGNAIRIFNVKGEEINVIPVDYPRGVAVDQSGQIYVAQTTYVSAITLDDEGKVAATRIVGKNYFSFASDVAVDSSGRVFVVDSVYNRIFVFGSDGSYITYFGKYYRTYRNPVALDIDEENKRIFVTYQDTYRLEVFDLSTFEVVHTISGQQIGPDPMAGSFNMLQGVAADSSGRYFVVDAMPDDVQFFDGCHTFIDFIGKHGYGPGELNLPLDVAADPYGRIYISNIDGRISIFRSALMEPPVPLSPNKGEVITGREISLIVTNGSIKPYESALYADNLTYEFQIATDENFRNVIAVSSPMITEGENTTSWLSSTLGDSGLYYWRARAFDGTAYGPWSQTWHFNLDIPNAPPRIDVFSPVDENPAIVVGNVLPFSVEATDPDGDLLTYAWLVDGVEVASVEAFDYLPLTEDIGEHTVEVRVSDILHVTTKLWNLTVKRVDTAPVAPSAYKPIGGEDVPTLTPQLSVNNSYDVEGDKLDYIFEISESLEFTSIVDTITVPEGLNVTVAAVGDNGSLTDNRLYYWRARSCEREFEGMCSPYSAAESFFVNTANDAPAKPGIVSPSGGTEVDTVTPSLSVTRSSDIDHNDTLSYIFEIAADPDYLTIVRKVEGVVPKEGEDKVVWPATDAVWEGDSLDDNRMYYWRSRAVDNHGLGSGWVKASFFVNTANDAPAKPLISSPAPESEVESKIVTLITNNSIDPDMDSLLYSFEIDKTANFESQDLLVSPLIVEGVDVTSWLIPQELLENTVYYWRVKVKDGSTETVSDTASFFVNTINEPPYTPSLNFPVDDAKVLTDTPQLSLYSSSDPDHDKVKYTFQISENADFGYIVDQSLLTDGTWKVSVPLIENRNYYWRAAAMDEHDMSSQWSEPWSFMVNVTNEAPAAPVISNHMFGMTDSIVLEISNSTDPEGDGLTYNVEIFSDKNLTKKISAADQIPEGEEITLWTPEVALHNGVYYWRARAHDGETYGIWSGTRELHIDNARKNSDPRTDKAYGRKRF